MYFHVGGSFAGLFCFKIVIVVIISFDRRRFHPSTFIKVSRGLEVLPALQLSTYFFSIKIAEQTNFIAPRRRNNRDTVRGVTRIYFAARGIGVNEYVLWKNIRYWPTGSRSDYRRRCLAQAAGRQCQE